MQEQVAMLFARREQWEGTSTSLRFVKEPNTQKSLDDTSSHTAPSRTPSHSLLLFVCWHLHSFHTCVHIHNTFTNKLPPWPVIPCPLCDRSRSLCAPHHKRSTRAISPANRPFTPRGSAAGCEIRGTLGLSGLARTRISTSGCQCVGSGESCSNISALLKEHIPALVREQHR